MSKQVKQAKIGGQALFDGIMMRGEKKAAMAVRKKDGTIHVEEWELPKKKWYQKAFFIRGIFNFILQMKDGYKYMMKSAEISGYLDEEEGAQMGKFENWLTEKFGDKLMSVVMVLGIIFGFALTLLLFMFVPSFIFTGIDYLMPESVNLQPYQSLFEGLLRITIFIIYLALTSLMKDIRKTFQYHGAEHKTIFANESGAELNVENVRNYKRFHPRCGTSFIFLMLAISIIFYTLMPFDNRVISEALEINTFAASAVWTMIRLALLPVLVGISYELLKLAGRYDRNILMRIISAPGMGIQRLTTKDPTDDQLEVALAAFIPVLPQDEKPDVT
ncbi:MAG: DUF1385 domain-containing protein [Oscillospiraceae bacterium]|jgi:uncharacterized protein YqhQ|nr:DUF1385 domain-containing protein [Oscillospiraceae bacterium]